MHIICPHCTTSYAIDPATLGVAGRTVRCSRCKEVWLARPEDAHAETPVAAMAESGSDPASGYDTPAPGDNRQDDETPIVDSPSISAEFPSGSDSPQGHIEPHWKAPASDPIDRNVKAARAPRPSWLARLRPSPSLRRLGKPFLNLSTACAAMGALVLALTIWRVDVVRLLPQTAAFYKMIGLEVNLRGLAFKDIKITTETVAGKPVLLIEGVIVVETRKAVELPRLRFSVRDAQGAEIYAWNAVLEQPVLKPGEKAWFKSRLASPPADGRNIDVRFFSKRDIAAGGGV